MFFVTACRGFVPGALSWPTLILYLPDGGSAGFLFGGFRLRNETETIGALATEIPVAALNSITTSGQEWEKFGLQSGEELRRWW